MGCGLMLETRTLCLYGQTRRRVSVFRRLTSGAVFWTARAASDPIRAARIVGPKPKTPLTSIIYERCTAWTAISGFSMMRVCAQIINPTYITSKYSLSRHIKPRPCCPSCPSIDFIEENIALAARLHVRLFLISALAVQERQKRSVFLVNVAFPTRLERENTVRETDVNGVNAHG